MREFLRRTADLPRPIRILDLGGTREFWEQSGVELQGDFEITLVNLDAMEWEAGVFRSMRGDATDLSSLQREDYDVIFSNSVIEHLFTFEMQKRMADEIRRLGLPYWVQTPNYWFPYEPHFCSMGWQYLPRSTRIQRVMNRRGVDQAIAARVVDEHRLMTASELAALFPGARLIKERVGPLVKSLVAWCDGEGDGAGLRRP